jgi:hypothetical protein
MRLSQVCCSDHQVSLAPLLFRRIKADGIRRITFAQSFHFQGFPATQLFERAGRIADPMYHNSGANFCIVSDRTTTYQR